MKERPILFAGPMVRAILEGRKTQTRRLIRPQPEMIMDGESLPDGTVYCGWEPVLPSWSKWPYQSGMELWVKETWATDIPGCPNGISYRADHIGPKGGRPANPIKWRPSIFMPKSASRVRLEIVRVRAELLQSISEDDAIAEGVEGWDVHYYDDAQDYWRNYLMTREQERNGSQHFTDPIKSYKSLWDSFNREKLPWKSNPWVWVIEFKRKDVSLQ